MSSINTNLSAMTALQSLKSTQTGLAKTQAQISTGLRVGEASHNASYWSIATKMKSDNGALSAVKDSIGQSKAMIDTFSSAMDKSLVYLNKMKEGLVVASQPGADLTAIQTEFAANIEGLKSAATTASFNGQNWLATETPTPGNVNLVTSYNGSTKAVETLKVDLASVQLFEVDNAGVIVAGGILNDTTTATSSIMDMDISGLDMSVAADQTTMADYLKAVDDAIGKVTTGASMLGANKALLETQESFIDVLSDSLTAGVSTFVDADMNEASTRLQAQQTQQQLGVQALSIANQNSQMIMRLFQ